MSWKLKQLIKYKIEELLVPQFLQQMKKIIYVFILILLNSCNNKKNNGNVEYEVLNEYQTYIDYTSDFIAVPTIIKYDSSLYIYDNILNKIYKIGENKKVVKEYGRVGAGPGEFISVNNIYLRKNYIYIVDSILFRIHKYDKNGEFISTFDYGKYIGKANPPPPPSNPNVIKPKNIDNKPFVFQEERIALSSTAINAKNNYLFKVFDWEHNHLNSLGNIPEGSTFILDSELIKDEVSNEIIPSYYKSNSFIVNINSNEFYIIFNSIPKIVKYNNQNETLWENKIIHQDIDSIRANFFFIMNKMKNSNSRIDLRFYNYGISNENGELYLVVNKTPTSIHKFDKIGNLVKVYEFTTDQITPVLDIDFHNKHIFAVTEMGEIRKYTFNP